MTPLSSVMLRAWNLDLSTVYPRLGDLDLPEFIGIDLERIVFEDREVCILTGLKRTEFVANSELSSCDDGHAFESRFVSERIRPGRPPSRRSSSGASRPSQFAQRTLLGEHGQSL